MHALPTGELTLLFTDIESSTELADALGGGWEPVLEAHRDLIRTAATDAGGNGAARSSPSSATTTR